MTPDIKLHPMASSTSQSLPMDIVATEILPRTKVKSLLRFKCVSKSFYALISSHAFINLHALRSLTSHNNHLLICLNSHPGFYSLDLEPPDIPPRHHDFPFPVEVKKGHHQFEIVGSCNGLVCITNYSRPVGKPNTRHLVVFNPCTKVYQDIYFTDDSNEKLAQERYGFGYDAVEKDYKVVQISTSIEKQRIFIRSLKENTWRLIESTGLDCKIRNDSGTLIDNHLLHWRFWCFLDKKFRIRCFDVQEDNWVEDVPLPPNYGPNQLFDFEYDDQLNLWSLGILDGCLCAVTDRLGNPTYLADVWIMREYGNSDSWVKLSSISYQLHEWGTFFYPLVINPLAYSRSLVLIQLGQSNWSDIVSELVWCNTGDNPGVAEKSFLNVTKVCAYKESLVKLPCELEMGDGRI